ncbi:MAG TPA: GH1 family beta-glucosidase [Streptosporangiaceae bacterium]
MSLRFPTGFLLGAATAAYQIEGAAEEDGRGPSIWDTFSHTPGKVLHGDTGDIACDNYHRLDADLDLAAGLGLNSYRFSVAWPRIVPDGKGSVNQKGLDFYKRLVEGLNARAITPMATLYHWDLPQPLQDAGGWASRDTVERFCEFAQAVLEGIGDAVPMWVTVNEPFCAGMVGHLEGRHAPGLRDLHAALAATHHLLLAHGQAAGLVHSRVPGRQVGVTLNLSDISPASPAEADQTASRLLDGYENRWYLDAVLRGSYPQDMLDWYGQQVPVDFIRSGDLDVIAAATDFLGINYYETKIVAADPDEPCHQARVIPAAGRRDASGLTAGGLDARPAALGRILRRVHHEYAPPPLYITENGAPFHDYVDPEGRVQDIERVAYLSDHLGEALGAIEDGVDLRGYIAWSLLDNFEWADGYSRRFGLVYVDYATQARIPKASARWYQQLIAAQRD